MNDDAVEEDMHDQHSLKKSSHEKTSSTSNGSGRVGKHASGAHADKEGEQNENGKHEPMTCDGTSE